jgi:hypothetical protein
MRMLLAVVLVGAFALLAAAPAQAAYVVSCTIPYANGPQQCVVVGTPPGGSFCQQWNVPFPNPPGGVTYGHFCLP